MSLVFRISWCVALSTLVFISPVIAQGIQEDFNTVAGDPPAIVLDGSGFNQIDEWNSGITGEGAFAGTTGSISTLVSAFGLLTGGVSNSGAGAIEFLINSFNVVELDFENVAATGPVEILAGGAGPDTFNFISGWDVNLGDEFAFGGTSNGAVLNGNMSAEALLAGGNPGGLARLDVQDVTLNGGSWFAGLQFDTGAFPGATAIANPGFEDGTVGIPPTDWDFFGNGVLTDDVTPRTGDQVLTLFEFAQFAGSGITQRLPAQEGQTWELDCFVRTNTGDSIVGTNNFVVTRIQYFDATNGLLASQELQVIAGGGVSGPFPAEDAWIDAPALSLLAPFGTNSIDVAVIYVNLSGANPGSVQVDDVTLNLVSGPQPVAIGNFALFADVRGIADAVGETLGTVQLRIEDSDGDRIFFDTTATGGFQSLGGALNTGTETDSTGTPTPGAFNILSPFFRVVVAMESDSAAPWGTGGTVEVDNVELTNSNPAGSGFDAGLIFEQVQLSEIDPANIQVTADVFGDTAGGEYELRIIALDVFDAGLDEDFESVVDTTEVVFIDSTTVQALEPNTVSSVAGWSPDIEGEEAFGGIIGLVDTVQFSPRVLARGIDSLSSSGCQQSSRGGKIVVESVSTSGDWFAGLSWPRQKLASADLSQVTMTACIRGLEDPSDPFGLGQGNGFTGPFHFRIEDPDGDFLVFPGTAVAGNAGVWQSMGGTLDTATFGAAFSGTSNEIFDIDVSDPDSLDYTVVIAFANPANTWFSGGELEVDNLFLTPVQASVEVASFSFDGVANGASFQSIGGALNTANGPALGNFDEDFESAAGAPGRTSTGGNDGDWDDNLNGENFFFGGFGATIIGGASVNACASCGVGGSRAAELTVTNNPTNGAGWFAGIFFQAVPIDLSGDLSQILLTADIKGEINGGILGEYQLRIEDSGARALAFTVIADQTFQSVGGALSGATVVNVEGGGDLNFDFNQGTYNITVAFVGLDANWGPGGKLTIDNLFATGRDLSAADEYEVSLSFRNPVASYPGGTGLLVLDNLNVTEGAVANAGDVNCDGSINGLDVQAFATAILDPSGYATVYPGCNILNADTNSDSVVTVADVSSFAALLVGP